MPPSFESRLGAGNAGLYAFERRAPQYEDTLEDDGSDAGFNLLYPAIEPITVTVTRTLEAAQSAPPSDDQDSLFSSTLYSRETPSPSYSAMIPNDGRSDYASSVGKDLNNPSPDNQNTTPDGSGKAQSKKLPAGLVIGLVILFLFIAVAVIFFIVRRRYVRRRQVFRKEWSTSKAARLSNPAINSEPKTPLPDDHPAILALAASFRSAASSSPSSTSTTFKGNDVLSVPPTSYGNEAPFSSKRSSVLGYGPPTTTILSQPIATVVSTFITTLPDEMAVTIGEAVRVLSEYDDGWALCVNSRGEKGMVPMECLDGRYSYAAANEASDMTRGVGGNRKRISSLQPNVGKMGRF